MLTLAEVKDDRGINAVAGVCSTSDAFADLINEACRKAMRRGDWEGTVVPIQVCVKRGCVVFPRYVSQIRKINLCNQPLPVNNLWYDYLRFDSQSLWESCLGQKCSLNAQGYAPTYNSVFGDGRQIRAYPQQSADVGKTIKIFGVDNSGQPLRTVSSAGVWTEGITLTLALPFVASSQLVRQVDRVIKQVTQTSVFLYAYDTATGALEDLAVYEPSETNPSYARYKLHTCGCNTAASCSDSQSVIALVKLKFIPASTDTDIVYIQNLDALKLMIQSIKAGESGDRAGALGYEQDAIRELNLELSDASPDDTTPVTIAAFNGLPIGNQSVI